MNEGGTSHDDRREQPTCDTTQRALRVRSAREPPHTNQRKTGKHKRASGTRAVVPKPDGDEPVALVTVHDVYAVAPARSHRVLPAHTFQIALGLSSSARLADPQTLPPPHRNGPAWTPWSSDARQGVVIRSPEDGSHLSCLLLLPLCPRCRSLPQPASRPPSLRELVDLVMKMWLYRRSR